MMSFFNRRFDLDRQRIEFSNLANNDSDTAIISTNISLIAIDIT